MAGLCYGKQKWPELVGEQVSMALATIHRENSYVQPIVVQAGSITPGTADFRCDRVVVIVEGSIVSRVPIVG
ncbi:hypothetical protein Sjap_003574 [Stephania japonica]|uniref:Uncharacterized protein n=1 Tax=Stephania japonica TaxID=461633 RepID=A0AAP0KQS0_9MAGN